MSSTPPWAEVELQVLDQVFYAWSPDDVRRAPDLAAAGFIDSLSVVAALEVLISAAGNEDALGLATADDFRNMETIRALYERL